MGDLKTCNERQGLDDHSSPNQRVQNERRMKQCGCNVISHDVDDCKAIHSLIGVPYLTSMVSHVASVR